MDDVRYIILPGDLRKDDRLTLAHFKVAMVLGAYSKRHGWTDLTQSDVGEMAGLSRETVCRCVGDLVDWRWVARKKKSKKNQYVYRFIMDRDEDCEQQITFSEKQCEPQITGNVISSFTFTKEDSSSLKSSTLAPLPPTAEQVADAQSGQDENIDLKAYDRTVRRPPIVTDADRQWAIEQKPANWDVEAPNLAWEDHVAEQAEAFEAHYVDDRKPLTEWSGLWRRSWWKAADPSIRHPKEAPARPHPFVTSKDQAWSRVLEVLTKDERKVAERFGVAQFRPDDPRAAVIGGANA